MTEITPALIAEHGLSLEEYDRIKGLLGRDANLVELGARIRRCVRRLCRYQNSTGHRGSSY